MHRLGLWMGLSPKPISHEVIDTCLGYSWPGNVRELENFVKRLLVLDDEDSTLAELRGEHARRSEGQDSPRRMSRIKSPTDLKILIRSLKAEAEKEAIQLALEQSGGNRKEAARLLNICTKALVQKVRQYGVVTGAPADLSTFPASAAEPMRLREADRE